MIKRRRFPKIFFGWWTVLAGGLIAFWGYGYRIWGFSALFKPIASELGFSRAVTSTAASIGRLEGGFEAPVTGWLTDKFGPRWIVTAGVFIMGLGLILMYFVNSLWAYLVIWGVILGTGSNIALSIPIEKAVTDWFVKKRGLALGIRWVFTGSAGVLMLPLVAWLIATQGWQMACVVGGVVMLVVGLPLAWFGMKQHRPEYYGLLPDGAIAEEEAETRRMIERGVEYAAEVEEVEFTLRQSMKTAAYWLIIVAHAAHGMLGGAIIIHSIPLLTDMGVDPVKAAAMAGMTVIVMLPSMFIGGLIADRVKKGYLRFLMAGAYFLQAVGIGLFLLNPTIAMVYVWYTLHWFATGISTPINSILMSRYFGRKGFGSIRGTSSLFMTPVGVIAPIYTGWVFDTTGSYITAFTVFAALLALGAVVMSFAFPPKPPARVTDVDKFL